MKFNGLKVGDKVVANGYEGTVVALCDWSNGGLVEVRLPGGVACISIHDCKFA